MTQLHEPTVDTTQSTVEAAASQLLAEARATTEVMTQADLFESLSINQMLGIASYARALDSLNKVTMLKALQRVKDSKSYKTMVLPGPDGTLIRPKTWDGLCKVLNLSRSKVDEDLENLAIFGGKLLEEQKALGIGYRDLRALKSGMNELPAGEQQAVRELIDQAVESGDKEEILATLDEIGARNAKLSGELASTKKNLKAKDDLQAKTTEKVNTLEIRLEQALNPASEDERQQNLNDARDVFRQRIDGACNSLVGSTTSMCNFIANTLKADTEAQGSHLANPQSNPQGSHLGEPVINAEMWAHLNARVGLMCQALHSLMLEAKLEVDFAAEFDPMPPDGFGGFGGFDDVDLPDHESTKQ